MQWSGRPAGWRLSEVQVCMSIVPAVFGGCGASLWADISPGTCRGARVAASSRIMGAVLAWPCDSARGRSRQRARRECQSLDHLCCQAREEYRRARSVPSS